MSQGRVEAVEFGGTLTKGSGFPFLKHVVADVGCVGFVKQRVGTSLQHHDTVLRNHHHNLQEKKGVVNIRSVLLIVGG